MSTRMLIDAAHAEETRVAVVRGSRIEEFDFEAASRKQLRGNIYLARVTRVEPSLQAAFIEYGGNRHGFLAFNEIHPDYYQIPVEDRQALLEEEAQEQTDSAAAEEAEADADIDASGAEKEDSEPEVEDVGADDDLEQPAPRRERARTRRYKIQEVIKRRQILLIQVVKEERGNKGAALTTYLSLAGRYCVLMPNTARGGGISRRIASSGDRKKLRNTLKELDVPKGMGCIIRTAGSTRNKSEIKRDYLYLLRLWDSVRELTLESIAPALIYEEGSLLKRTIRDSYTSEIDEIFVEGKDAYRSVKSFMKMLMPSHARKVKEYAEDHPLFHRYQVEGQLETMFSPTVSLKSGGYLVINPTEALVAIDVNSGRATRERNIEKTAYRTNMEAAEEVARQLRLRDLAGLIVIDFIDMEDNRNNRSVERKMKESLKRDRARLQVGRISPFGLMEMSRQRMRPGLLEATTEPCPVCDSAGVIRSTESTALQILRALEQEGIQGKHADVRVSASPDVALFLLNAKRHELADIEKKYSLSVEVQSDSTLHRPHYDLRGEGGARDNTGPAAITPETGLAGTVVEEVQDDTDPAKEAGPKKRSRRRRKKATETEVADVQEDATKEAEVEAAGEDAEAAPKRRRRGRRGGRRRRKPDTDVTPSEESETQEDGETPIAVDAGNEEQPAEKAETEGSAVDGPKLSEVEAAEVDTPETGSEESISAESSEESAPPPVATEPTVEVETVEHMAEASENGSGTPSEPEKVVETAAAAPAETPQTGPRRKGWWSRPGGT